MQFVSLEKCAQNPSCLNIWGRTGYTEDGKIRLNPLTLFWTASGIECAVKTCFLFAEIECTYKCYRPYISIWLNGKRIRRIAPEQGRTRICIFDGKKDNAPEVKHIRILKECQAMAGDSRHGICIHGFFIDDEETVSTVFVPLLRRPLFFEFIGDSITCGEGLEDPVEGKDWNPAWQGTRNHCALILSKRFNADIAVLAQSGWGLLCGWNNDPACTVPPLYPFVCALAKGERNRNAGARQFWNFSHRKTDAVIVNLGSNDEYAFRADAWKDPVSGKEHKLCGKTDYARLKAAAKNFIGEIRRHNPEALIIWCYGMYLTGCTDLFKIAVEEYRAEHADERVCFIRLSPMDDTTAGAQKHPGPLCHKEAADLISKRLRQTVRTEAFTGF